MLLLAIADKTVGQNWLKFLKGNPWFPRGNKSNSNFYSFKIRFLKRIPRAMPETSASIKYIDRRSVSPYLGSFDFSSYFDFAIDGT